MPRQIVTVTLQQCNMHSNFHRLDSELLCLDCLVRSAAKLFDNGCVWFATTTDRGSNEVAARNIVQAYISMHLGTAPVFYSNSDCNEHLAHLITLGSMKLVDEELQGIRDWKYFSSLAVFSNTVRGLAKNLYNEWCAQHGHLSGRKSVYKLFPRCESGRWNSTDVTEKRIRNCSKEMFEPVLQKILGQAISEDKCGPENVWSSNDKTATAPAAASSASGPAKSAAKGKAKAQAKKKAMDLNGPSELSMQESQEYSKKIGKYRRSTLMVVNDWLWWRLIDIMNITKQATVHLSAFLKKTIPKDQLAIEGNALAQLVNGKASELMLEYENSLDSAELKAALHKSLPSAKDKSLVSECLARVWVLLIFANFAVVVVD